MDSQLEEIEVKMKFITLKQNLCHKITTYIKNTPTNQLEYLINYINLVYKKYKIKTKPTEDNTTIKVVEPDEIRFLILFYEFIDKKITNERTNQSTVRTVEYRQSYITENLTNTVIDGITNIIFEVKNPELVKDIYDFFP
jgi:hypothetical protein